MRGQLQAGTISVLMRLNINLSHCYCLHIHISEKILPFPIKASNMCTWMRRAFDMAEGERPMDNFFQCQSPIPFLNMTA